MTVQWITAADLAQPTADSASDAAAYASYVLYKLTGEKYPGVSTSVDIYTMNIDRPTLIQDYGAALSLIGLPLTYLEHITVYEGYDARPIRLKLRSTPVQSVTRVIEGKTLYAPEDYLIGNKNFLLKTGNRRWELEAGVLVEYTHGTVVPAAGKMAAIELANQMVLLETDPDACLLPDRVTSISRQGVSFTILDPQNFLKEGRTGLYNVDLFIKSVNPVNALKKAKIFSPDVPKGIRGT